MVERNSYFIDTNVWVYLYYSPIENPEVMDMYAKILTHIQENNKKIITNVVQISEIINLMLRLEHRSFNRKRKKQKKSQMGFKKFRGSEEYRNFFKIHKARLEKSILPKCEILNDNIESYGLGNILIEEPVDFNDQFFVEFAKYHDAAIVTHDKDFKRVEDEIDIITYH